MNSIDAIAFLNNLPSGMLEALLAAIGITLLVQRFKKWLEQTQEQKKEWIYVLVSSTLAFAAAACDYALSGGLQSWTVLGENTTTIIGVITLIYHLPKVGIKALSQTAEDARLGKAVRTQPEFVTPQLVMPSKPVLEGEL